MIVFKVAGAVAPCRVSRIAYLEKRKRSRGRPPSFSNESGTDVWNLHFCLSTHGAGLWRFCFEPQQPYTDGQRGGTERKRAEHQVGTESACRGEVHGKYQKESQDGQDGGHGADQNGQSRGGSEDAAHRAGILSHLPDTHGCVPVGTGGRPKKKKRALNSLPLYRALFSVGFGSVVDDFLVAVEHYVVFSIGPGAGPIVHVSLMPGVGFGNGAVEVGCHVDGVLDEGIYSLIKEVSAENVVHENLLCLGMSCSGRCIAVIRVNRNVEVWGKKRGGTAVGPSLVLRCDQSLSSSSWIWRYESGMAVPAGTSNSMPMVPL